MQDYSEIYDIAERYFSWKRAQMVGLIRQDIEQALTNRPSTNARFKLVDFGCGDGRLIRDVVINLPEEMRAAIDLVCIEPDNSNFATLTETFNQDAALLGSLELSQETMADYIARIEDKYDMCLMTHMLYHIDPSEWGTEISAALGSLQDGGSAHISLVDEDGTVYELAKKHNLIAEDNNAIGGGYIFASDLENVLDNMPDIETEKTRNAGYLRMDLYEVEVFLKTLKDSPEDLAENPFVQFLGFILREEPETIAANTELMQGFATHFRNRGLLSTTDNLYKVTPQI